jgi:hypothetical protein
VNAYVLDPSHIAPSRSDANSNGHFPIPNNHMPGGTPRGFNLQNMMSFNQNGMGPLGFHGAGQPFLGGMGGPTYTGNGGLATGMDMAGMHNPGAIRRGVNNHRFNPRNGPYDRRVGGGGGGRMGYVAGPGTPGAGSFSMGGAPGGIMRFPSTGGGGMGMGFLAQGGGGGGGKWGDGAGGGMPREAVQGRSIKSYEDLDAQPGQGSGMGTGAVAAGAGNGGAAELDY